MVAIHGCGHYGNMQVLCQLQHSDNVPTSITSISIAVARNSILPNHMDLAGPFKGKMFLIIIDAYSKWLDVIPVKKTTSTVMIKHLRRTIAQHGLPTYLVTDNGPQFT